MPDEKKDALPSMNDGGNRVSYGDGKAIREPATGKGRFDLITPFGIMRLAKWYEAGAMKYADRNWENGMPLSRYIDSALRHINKYIMGMQDEDHLAAAAWNILAIIHHEELGQTDLDDMPHYLSKTTSNEINEEHHSTSVYDRWCYHQSPSESGLMMLCSAHINNGKGLYCKYKNIEDRSESIHPCSEYKPYSDVEEDK